MAALLHVVKTVVALAMPCSVNSAGRSTMLGCWHDAIHSLVWIQGKLDIMEVFGQSPQSFITKFYCNAMALCVVCVCVCVRACVCVCVWPWCQ